MNRRDRLGLALVLLLLTASGALLAVGALLLLPSLAWAGAQAQHGAVTCIPAAVTQIRPASPGRRTLLLVNAGTLTIHVGSGAPDALTTANGIPIAANGSKSLDGADGYTGAYSCITAEGNQSLRWEETF